MYKKIVDQEFDDDQDQERQIIKPAIKRAPIEKYDELGFDDEDDYEKYSRFIK